MSLPRLASLVAALTLAALVASPAEAKKHHHRIKAQQPHQDAGEPAQLPKYDRSSLEARHQVCLAFIKRRGLDCDPWQTPTCGAGTLYARPLECVAP
jgi:hypothetical protein